jgi:hypothetical protein
MTSRTIIFTAFKYEEYKSFIDNIECDWALGQEESTKDGKPHI